MSKPLGSSLGTLELTGSIYRRGGAGSKVINKLGAGTLILSGDSGLPESNDQDGPLTSSTFNINSGTLVLRGTTTNTANIPGVNNWNLNGGRMVLEKATALGSATLSFSNSNGILNNTASMSISNPLVVNAGGGAVTTGVTHSPSAAAAVPPGRETSGSWAGSSSSIEPAEPPPSRRAPFHHPAHRQGERQWNGQRAVGWRPSRAGRQRLHRGVDHRSFD